MNQSYLHIDINRNSGISLSRQVYEKIRDDILLNRLLPGSRLPASRMLAKELGISRNVVMDAYDQLHAEGYIESRAGSYTRVSDDTHYRGYKGSPSLQKKFHTSQDLVDVAFQTGVPDLSCFPAIQWGRYLKQAVSQAEPDDLDYSKPEGHDGFRQVLADYLYRARGIGVDPDHIVVTSGATQALYLAAQILFEPGCKALIEDPGGFGMLQILKTAGYALHPVKNGPGGLDADNLVIKRGTRLACVTPSHQFPMGNIMPAAARIKLLNAISGHDTYIVEDDYDSEFRYNGAPVHPLKALDPDKVIYIGSFSKVLSPALRIGYAVVPEKILDSFKNLKRFSDAGSALIEQIALKNFIRDGGFERHVFKMKKIYKKKRDILLKSLSDAFGSDVEIFGENAGLHLVARFKNMKFELDDQYNLLHNRILIPSVEKHAIAMGNHGDKLVFGYGNLTCEKIVQGISALNCFK